MHCQLGQMKRAVKRSGGVGKKVSKYKAGSEIIECKTRNIEKYIGRQT